MNYTRLTLTYYISKLLDQIQLRSLYTASRTPSDASPEANLSITDAELDITNFNLRDASHNAYKALQSLTRYNSMPYDYDYSEGGHRKIKFELWMNEDWDRNLREPLYTAVENMMVFYCLREWFGQTGQKFDYYAAMYDNAYKEVKGIINYRKEPVRRSYTTI